MPGWVSFLLLLSLHLCVGRGVGSHAGSRCPEEGAIAPCQCTDGHSLTLECNFISDLDLVRVFRTEFPVTEFDELSIYSGDVTSLREIPNGLTFVSVLIHADRLTSFGDSFLTNSTDLLKDLQISVSSLETDSFPFETLPLYKILTKLHIKSTFTFEGPLPKIVSESLQTVNFGYNKITEIDSDTFLAAPLLRSVDLTSNALTSVGRHTFRLRGGEVNEVLLGLNDIAEVHEEAFVLPAQREADTRVTVSLYNNELTSVKETIYRPLVDLDSRPLYQHPVDVSGNPVGCSCGEAWLALASPDGETPYGHWVSGTCLGGPSFANLQPWDFEECFTLPPAHPIA